MIRTRNMDSPTTVDEEPKKEAQDRENLVLLPSGPDTVRKPIFALCLAATTMIL